MFSQRDAKCEVLIKHSLDMSRIARTVPGVRTRVQNRGGNCGTNTLSKKRRKLVTRSQNPYELDQMKR